MGGSSLGNGGTYGSGGERVTKGGSEQPSQSSPASRLRCGLLTAVPSVWGQQQWEALWHLCLQRLQWLLQEECETEAHLQVPPALPSRPGVHSVGGRCSGKAEDETRAKLSQLKAWSQGMTLAPKELMSSAGARSGQECAQWIRPIETSARPAG